MSRELNEACARALGYTTLWAEDSAFGPSLYLHDAGAIRESESVTANCHLLGARWERLRVDGEVGEYFVRLCPAFSENHEAARLLEDEIERRGLWGVYLTALIKLLNIHGDRTWFDWDREWVHAVAIMLRATPEQRARAFLEAVANA